jgi:ClpP class serine protease
MVELWACMLDFLQGGFAERVLAADVETAIKAESRDFSAPGILDVSGDSATINIQGPLSASVSKIAQMLGYGGTGYSDILSALDAIKKDESIRNVTLAINSPGGSIVGLDQVWQAVKDLGKTRNVIAENRGIMASAAYWIASAANSIWATSPATMTGSIGVQMVLVDYSEYDKKAGIKEIQIVSSNAPNKNPDPTTKAGRAAYQAQLDALEQVFLARVAEGRKTTIEDVAKNYGAGAMLISSSPSNGDKTSVSVGMIDGVIGGFDRKIDPISENAKTEEIPQIFTETKMNLAEFLAANPEARQAIADLEGAAYKRGSDEYKARYAQAGLVLSGEYPTVMKDLANKVMTGELRPEVLQGALAMHTHTAEQNKTAQAVEETAKIAETPAVPEHKTTSTDGVIRSEDDYKASVNKERVARGLAPLA